MDSLLKFVFFLIIGMLLLALAIVFLPFLILFALIRMLTGKRVFVYNTRTFFNRPGQPQADPEASAGPHVPASEDIIDVEVVEIPDEKSKHLDS